MDNNTDNYAVDSSGLLYIADGLSPVRLWDSLTATTEEAGLAAPLTATTIAVVDAAGDILGEFTAFVRFRDKRGLYSNLSPISNTLTAKRAATLTVAGATNAEPIEITTSGAHGLANGNRVTIASVGGNTAANDTWTVTVTGATTFTLDNSEGNAAYTSGGTVTVGVTTIAYSSVPVATGIGASKVVARELFRNLDGDTDTYYLDATIEDNVTTTASSTNNDTELATQTALRLLLPDLSLNANLHDVPPAHKTVLVQHQGVMFSLVDKVVTDGAAIVTNGDATVEGIATNWTTSLAGRFFYPAGSTRSYEILSVTDGTHLELTINYAGTTDNYATYAIKPAPAERRLVYFSEPNLAGSVPPINAFSIQEDGSELTGGVAKSSFVYFISERKSYRFTFRTDPAIDGFTFLAIDRGCVNQKCIVPVDATIYMLDQAGIHSFDGSESTPVSEGIQEMFNPEPDDDSGLKINWNAAERFFGVHYPAEETVRYFVCMSGQLYPRHAITYDYRGQAIWIEEYPRPISAACTGTVAGARRMYFGSEGKKVFLHGASKLDGINPNAGVLRGTATSSTAGTLTDTTADFPTAALPGLSVSIAEGRGRGQRRTIHEATSTVLSVTTPWLVLPDTSSVYQIAGIDYEWVSQWFKWTSRSENNEARTVAITFQPLSEPSPAALRIFEDYSEDAKVWGHTLAADRAEGFGSVDGDTHLSLDLSRAIGYAQQRLDENREKHSDGNRTINFELTGSANAEQVVIYEIGVEGAA